MTKSDVSGVLVLAAAAIGVAVVAKRLAPKMRPIDWEQRFERMPDNAPRKWMFTNIKAIRDNTDRILEQLARQTPAPPEPREPTT
jgi:hypothetical protein